MMNTYHIVMYSAAIIYVIMVVFHMVACCRGIAFSSAVIPLHTLFLVTLKCLIHPFLELCACQV